MKRPVLRVSGKKHVSESSFISVAWVLPNQSQVSSSASTINQGDFTKKLLALKKKRDKELEDKKQAMLGARREEQQKKAEDAARKRHEQAQKKAADAKRKRQAVAEKREKRKEEAVVNKKSIAETRKILQRQRRL